MARSSISSDPTGSQGCADSCSPEAKTFEDPQVIQITQITIINHLQKELTRIIAQLEPCSDVAITGAVEHLTRAQSAMCDAVKVLASRNLSRAYQVQTGDNKVTNPKPTSQLTATERAGLFQHWYETRELTGKDIG
jgi:hypothetical protein